MKLTNGEVFNAKEPIEALLQQKFPIKVSYGLAKLAAKLDGQLAVIDTVRRGVFQRYGKPSPENPSIIKVDPGTEEFAKVAEEVGELMRQEVELDIEPVELPDDIEIEPGVLMMLERFIIIK